MAGVDDGRVVRLGLVGAGYWATSAHVPSVADEPRARWTRIASAGGESARKLAEDLASAPRVLEDAFAVARSDAVDAVVVTSPATTHHAVTLAALEAGKHVLCEAPLGCNAREAIEMRDAAAERGLVGAYVRPRPFLYGGVVVAEALRSGAIGEPRSALLSWRGNPWLLAPPAATWRNRADAGPSVLAGVILGTLGALFGPATRVAGTLRRTLPFDPSGPEPAPDLVNGTLVTRGGVDVAFQAGHSPLEPEGTGLTVFGSEGTLTWSWQAPPVVRLARAGADAWEELAFAPEPDLGRAWPYTRAFVRAVLGEIPDGGLHGPDFEGGVHELEAVDALAASSAAGGSPVEVGA